jgi:hypothetical protein
MNIISDYKDFNTSPFLLSSLQGSNIINILEAGDSQFNDLETSLRDLYTNMQITTAVGVQLENIGKILCSPRSTLLDENYRIMLRIIAGVYRTCGQVEGFYKAIKSLYPGVWITYNPEYPAKAKIWWSSALLSGVLAQFLYLLAPAGVDILFTDDCGKLMEVYYGY